MARNFKRVRLGEALVEDGFINEEQLEEALVAAKNKGQKLGEYLVEAGAVSEEEIAKVLSRQMDLPYVDIKAVDIPDNVLKLVDFDILNKKKEIPFGYDENNPNILNLAVSDPLDFDAQEDISMLTNLEIQPYVATLSGIVETLDKYYGQKSNTEDLEKFAKEKGLVQDEVDTQREEDVANSPIVKIVKEMIEKAVRQRTSDIHIEALERQVRVRYRIDGVLYERARYELVFLNALVARIKVIGGMDIAEKRKPQDGRITQVVDHVEYDIRVSVLPTVFGEKVVMRLNSKSGMKREKSKLGLKDYEEKQFDNLLAHPNGIILVTGPTGSGKSTTLYTALSELNSEAVNIITVEDPVETNVDGINQVQTNNKADLTFASALRSILRQDPDIIMIGEIRDEETARIAVQASITGHLVVSTLHTNSSAATITRLEDMGLEPYLIADSVIGVIAQRLVRRLCPLCKKPRLATKLEKEIMNIPPEHMEDEITIYEPNGCQQCDNLGYKGRIGVYEIMVITEHMRETISSRATVGQIKQEALAEGMHTLHMSGTEYVLDGTTSYSEMMRISFDS